MAQQDRRAVRAMPLTVRVVFAPSRVAGECISRAYAVVVPPARRRLPAAETTASPDRVPAVAERRRGGMGR
jgi:hypothetical protein